METLILQRVPYGNKNTLDENREYQLSGEMFGPVGTLKEWKGKFPEIRFEIVEGANNNNLYKESEEKK